MGGHVKPSRPDSPQPAPEFVRPPTAARAPSSGLARLTYSAEPFIPRAADTVRIDPGSGNAQARRSRLDEE